MGSGKRGRQLTRAGWIGLLIIILGAVLSGVGLYRLWTRAPTPVGSSPEEELRDRDRQELEKILQEQLSDD